MHLRCLATLTVLLAAAAVAAADAPPEPSPREGIAIFAGGCFWCMQPAFDAVDGVIETTVGYTGGDLPDPTYEQVSRGGTGHAEAIRVRFDPQRVSYERLLDVFWHNIDPTVRNRQFCDAGDQYRSAIFYVNEAQRLAAEASKRALLRSGRFERIETEIVPAGPFYAAEPYHQKYYEKHPIRYRAYRFGCGRDRRLRELWGDRAGGH